MGTFENLAKIYQDSLLSNNATESIGNIDGGSNKDGTATPATGGITTVTPHPQHRY